MTRPILPRDTDPTGFSEPLEALLLAVPEGLCATFVDSEGETIDLATRVDPYEARVYSAELALPLASLRNAARELSVGTARELRMIGERRSAVVRSVAEGCDLLLVIDGSLALPRGAFECARAAARLGAEAGVRGRPALSVVPESALGQTPRAFLEDGRTRRIASVLGAPDSTMTEALLVRTPEGDECVIAHDPTTERWFRV